jgi:hypothetical protein
VSPGRHTLCLQIERLLDAILADQATGNSYGFRVIAGEYGVSFTTALMQQADLRKARLENPIRRGDTA